MVTIRIRSRKERSRSGKLRPQERSPRKSLYMIYLAFMAILLPSSAQIYSSSTPLIGVHMGVSLIALLINVSTTLWSFSVNPKRLQHPPGAIIFKFVFYFTGSLSPVSILSIFLPRCSVWLKFPLISAILILFLARHLLRSSSYKQNSHSWGSSKLNQTTTTPNTSQNPTTSYIAKLKMLITRDRSEERQESIV